MFTDISTVCETGSTHSRELPGFKKTVFNPKTKICNIWSVTPPVLEFLHFGWRCTFGQHHCRGGSDRCTSRFRWSQVVLLCFYNCVSLFPTQHVTYQFTCITFMHKSSYASKTEVCDTYPVSHECIFQHLVPGCDPHTNKQYPTMLRQIPFMSPLCSPLNLLVSKHIDRFLQLLALPDKVFLSLPALENQSLFYVGIIHGHIGCWYSFPHSGQPPAACSLCDQAE